LTGPNINIFSKKNNNFNLLGSDDQSFVQQTVLDEEEFFDVILRAKAVASQARHLQECVDVLEKTCMTKTSLDQFETEQRCNILTQTLSRGRFGRRLNCRLPELLSFIY
jgi:hypothetical protein